MELLEVPFTTRLRYLPRRDSLEWREGKFVLVQQGEKYQLVNAETGQPLKLFDKNTRLSAEEFDGVQLVHAVLGEDKYLIFYLEGMEYFVWYDFEAELFDMGNCAWDYRGKKPGNLT